MHPLEALNETELTRLSKVSAHLLTTRQMLAQGHRPDRLHAGFGMDFLDHREFCAGDDSRDIDWRTTARSQHPLIRRYCEEATADWFIILDSSASMKIGKGKKWELALQCAAAMAYVLIHQGNRVGVLLFSNRIERLVPSGRGYSHYARILQALRSASPPTSGGGSSLRCCIPRIKRYSPVFLVSDFLTTQYMQDGLDALLHRGDRLHALQITSDQDYFIPAGHRGRLMDVETGHTITLDLNSIGRDRFLKERDNFLHAFSDYCRKRRILLSRHKDNADWKSVLVKHFQIPHSEP